MKKIIIFGILIAVLSIGAFAAISDQYKSPFNFPRRYGVERVTHYDPRVNYDRIDSTIYLQPVEASKYRGVGRGGYAPFYARGTARLKSTSWYGYPRAQVNVKVKDLEPSYRANKKFEVWLVDVDSGYRLSTGTFTTGFGGVGELKYDVENYIQTYDFVEITAEPLNDLDVRPGPAVLIGLINQNPNPNYYNPPPKQAKLATSQFTII